MSTDSKRNIRTKKKLKGGCDMWDNLFLILERITEPFSIKQKNGFLTLLFLIISLIWIFNPTLDLRFAGVIILFLMGFIIFGCVDVTNKREMHYDKVVTVLILIIGLCYLVSSIVFNEFSRLILAIFWLIELPIISLVVNKYNANKRLLSCLARGGIIAFIILFFLSAFFAPLNDLQYASIMLNPNGFGVFCTATLIFVIFIINERIVNKKIRSVLPLYVLLGIVLSMIVFCQSRTTYLCTIFIVAIWAVYLLNCAIKNKIFVAMTMKIVIMIIMVVIMFPVTSYSVVFIHNHFTRFESDLIGYNYEYYEGYYVKSKVDKNDNYSQVIKRCISGSGKRIGKGIKTNEDLSSGRVYIWKSAIKYLNYRGHSADSRFYVNFGYRLPKNTGETHNIFLQVGYYEGIITMIFFMVFAVAVTYKTFWYLLFSKKNYVDGNYTFAVFIILCAFGIATMLSGSYYPNNDNLTFIFWLTVPLFELHKRETY